MPLTPHRLLAVSASAVVATLALSGCGGGEQRVALAIQKAERPNGTVLLHVECADDIEIERRLDPEGSGLEQITVWGDPKMGTCDPTNQAALNDLGEDKFIDGATSQVVTVRPSDLDQGG